jgi:hypothetical protein
MDVQSLQNQLAVLQAKRTLIIAQAKASVDQLDKQIAAKQEEISKAQQ